MPARALRRCAVSRIAATWPFPSITSAGWAAVLGTGHGAAHEAAWPNDAQVAVAVLDDGLPRPSALEPSQHRDPRLVPTGRGVRPPGASVDGFLRRPAPAGPGEALCFPRRPMKVTPPFSTIDQT
jgi:hypothetical protein